MRKGERFLASRKSTKSKSSSRKNTSSSGKKGKRVSTSKTAQNKQERKYSQALRYILAIIFAFLSLFVILSYTNNEAILIALTGTLSKGLIGYGYWTLAVIFAICVYLLAFQWKKPVRLRMFCNLMIPILIGAVLQLMLAGTEISGSFTEIVQQLWTSGNALQSGGVLSGSIAIGLARLISSVGADIVFIILLIVCVFVTFNFSLEKFFELSSTNSKTTNKNGDNIGNEGSEDVNTEEKLEEAESEKEQDHYFSLVTHRRRQIDIPVDDEPETGKDIVKEESVSRESDSVSKEASVFQENKNGAFFNTNAGTPTPAEVLRSMRRQQKPHKVSENNKGKNGETHEPEIETDAETVEDSVSDKTNVGRTDAGRQDAAQLDNVSTNSSDTDTDEIEREVSAFNPDGSEGYKFPPLRLLNHDNKSDVDSDDKELLDNEKKISETIHSFGIEANITGVVRGPTVTRYELELNQGVRLSRLINLSDDIALAMGSPGVRIAPIPNKSKVGIEVPNRKVSIVPISALISSEEFKNSGSKVTFAVGKDIGSNCIVGDISKLPHLLVAGTTGSGKSVFINSLLLSILYKSSPEDVNLIMIDPKMVELNVYNGIPHLLIPVVTDPKKASGALQWAVTEMMRRYRTFAESHVREIKTYNQKAEKNGEKPMPFIVIVIDELADLMLVAAKEVEDSIVRIAQMGRAAGVHLVIATQRPSADVITGLMKANVPSRIAFAVASAMESRIILDTAGAEKLVGHGDMLYLPLGSKPLRVQGCLTTDEEVAAVVSFIKENNSAQYSDEIMAEVEKNAAEKGSTGHESAAEDKQGNDYDELLPAAIDVVVEYGQASVSMLQRRLKLGYSRAARLVDQMEEKGIVGPFEGSKPRQVLITKEQWKEMQYQNGMSDIADDEIEKPEVDPEEGEEGSTGH